jgi:hypothetical protein
MQEFGPPPDWTDEGVFIAGDDDRQPDWDTGPASRLRPTEHLVTSQRGGSRHG